MYVATQAANKNGKFSLEDKLLITLEHFKVITSQGTNHLLKLPFVRFLQKIILSEKIKLHH